MAGILAACGATNDAAQPSGTVPPGTIPTTSVPPTTQPIQYECTPADGPQTIEGEKPTVDIPAGDPPTELVTEDITVGDGPTAAAGDKVSLQYVGVLYSDGTEFDTSWKEGNEPIELVLGQGSVIPGWEQGIPGMNLGGRRQLVIPPDLAYGDQQKGEIPPGSTLVFVVDLAQVCKALPASTGTTVEGTGTTVPGATDTTVAGETTTTVAGETTTTVATESTTSTTGASTTTTVVG